MSGKGEDRTDTIIASAGCLKTQFNQARQSVEAAYQKMNAGSALECMERMLDVTIELAKEVKRLREEKSALEERVEELETPKTVKLSKTPSVKP